MKKIFSAIGVLLVIFSFSIFFGLTEESIGFLNYDTTYTIELNNEFMDLSEMNEIAVKNNVMLVNRQVLSSGIGTMHIKHRVINPIGDIKEGVEYNLFGIGKKEIEFIDDYESENFKKIFLYTNNEKKYNNVVQDIKERGYDIRTEKLQDMRYSLSGLLSKSFFQFYILVGLLSVIAIVSYYVFRLKEIGVLQLNGWSNKRISNKIIKVMIKTTLIAFITLWSAISFYVLIKDYNLIYNFIFISAVLIVFILLIFFICNKIASIFIGKINCVGAVKNKNNNKSFFIFLLIAKFITIIMLFNQIYSVYLNIHDYYDIMNTYDRLYECDLYKLEQHEALGEKYVDLINNEMNKIPDEYIFNYRDCNMDKYEFTSTEIEQLKDKGNYNDYNNVISCSYNFVEYLKVKDVAGRYIKNIKIDEFNNEESVCVLLIPIHYKNEVGRIRKELYIDCNNDIVKYYFIENNQVHNSFLSQETYYYDPIIMISDIEKEIGATFLTKEGKKMFEEILSKNGISKYTVYPESLVESLNASREMCDITLLRNIICFILAIIAYIIVTFSIITIYFELRKKKMGVYMLQGKYPIIDILILPLLNITLVTCVALKFNKYLLVVNVIEIIIYIILVYKYLKNKAILAIKGE